MARKFESQREKMVHQIGRAEFALQEARRMLTGGYRRTTAARDQIDTAIANLAEAFVPIDFGDPT